MAARYWAGQIGLPVTIIKGIEEIDRSATGYLEETAHDRQVAQFWSRPTERVRGWESVAECRARMVRGMTQTVDEANGATVAVVSHGAVSNMYVADLLGIEPGLETDQPKIGSWIVVDPVKRQALTEWTGY